MSSRTRRRAGRWRWIVLTALAAVVAGYLVAGFAVFVFPPQSAPAKADAVFVLGPSEPWRVAWAEQLARDGTVGNIVVSTPRYSVIPDICRTGFAAAAGVYCVVPEPATTRGEALQLRRLAGEHGWNRVVVITATPHVVRSRIIMASCAGVSVLVVGRSDGLTLGDWAGQWVYQTGAFAKLAVTRGCSD